MSAQRQTRRRAMAAVLIVLIGSAYFAAAALSAGPITPLKVRYGAVAEEVLHPYLTQNWQLFAPDPINEERGIVARARCTAGGETGFIDITTEHIDAIHASRLFPSRMSRVVSNGMLQLFIEDPYAAKFRTAQEDAPDGDEPTVPLTDEEVQAREQAEHVLARFAASEMQDNCDGSVGSVQIRYMFHRFPRWSERDNWRDRGEVEVAESKWHEIS